MAEGRIGRGLMVPVLLVNFVVYLILLGLAGWSIDKYIDGEQNHPHLGGNPSTTYMLVFALIGGTMGAASVLNGEVPVWLAQLLLRSSLGVSQQLPSDLLGKRSEWEDTEENACKHWNCSSQFQQ